MQSKTINLNWWYRRTTLEKCLTVLSTFACLFISSAEMKTAQNDVFLSAEGTAIASTILDKMKTEIEPCDDFYQFACGNFLDKTKIPEDKKSVTIFSETSDKLQEQLKDLIAAERPSTNPKSLRLPNEFYKVCMNENKIKTLGIKPIHHISESLGGWPVIVGPSWNSKNSWSWEETVKKFRHFGFGHTFLISFSVDEDFKNTTKRVIAFDQAYLGLSREYLIKGFDEPFVSAYYDYMVDIASLLGADKETAKIELKESLQFEIDLANISWPMENRRNFSALYNLRSVKELQETYTYVQWVDYINAMLPDKLNIDEKEVTNLAVPSYFDDLGKLLERTEKRVIANYLMWRMHEYTVVFLTEEFRKRKLQYDAVVTGKKEQQPRWKECVDTISNQLPISLGSLYVRKYFNEDSKAIALGMVENLRSAFNKILDEVEWMDDATKQKAKKKLRAMQTYIGYPDELLDNEKLEEYYRNLEIHPDKYFQSQLDINVFDYDHAYENLRMPVNKTDWKAHARPAIVNAFYNSVENSIQFPAGILQGNFFNSERPKYLNYGAIGFVIGHEITHGFDDEGRQFDLEGNLLDWWQPDTQKAFLEKAQCIIEQYSNYTDKQTGLKLNGVNTQGENIADNGGVKGSYMAYNKWVAENGEEPKLDGLKYTPNQMFWISAAQTWCSLYRTEALKNRITTGVHSPGEFRVLGPLSNMKDFAKDFQCPEGAPMNPVKKCEVW